MDQPVKQDALQELFDTIRDGDDAKHASSLVGESVLSMTNGHWTVTPLMAAIRWNRASIARMLINADVDVSSLQVAPLKSFRTLKDLPPVSKEGGKMPNSAMTPVAFAVALNRDPVTRMLLGKECAVDGVIVDRLASLPMQLLFRLELRRRALVAKAAETKQGAPNILSDAMELLWDVMNAGDEGALAGRVVRGFNIDVNRGWRSPKRATASSALMMAMLSRRPSIFLVFLLHGADVDRSQMLNGRLRRPLDFAMSAGEVDMARLLVEAGAETDKISLDDMLLSPSKRRAMQQLIDPQRIKQQQSPTVERKGLPKPLPEYTKGSTVIKETQRLSHTFKAKASGVVCRLKVLLGVARGLAYTHARNVVHCDVRADNVLVATETRKLCASKLSSSSRRKAVRELTHLSWDQLSNVQQVGSGHYSRVFSCEVFGLGLACKVLKSLDGDMEREIEAVNELSHRNVANVVGVVTEVPSSVLSDNAKPEQNNGDLTQTDNSAVGLLMERFRHGSLRQILQTPKLRTLFDGGRFSVLEGVLTDFGLAAKLGRKKDAGGADVKDDDQDGTYIYNEIYTNPEGRDAPWAWLDPMLLDEDPEDRAYSRMSDVYMFGILMWEVFTNCRERPWREAFLQHKLEERQQRGRPVELNARQRKRIMDSLTPSALGDLLFAGKLELAFPDQTPEGIVRLSRRMCSIKPSDRPTMAQVVTELEGMLDDAPQVSSDNEGEKGGNDVGRGAKSSEGTDKKGGSRNVEKMSVKQRDTAVGEDSVEGEMSSGSDCEGSEAYMTCVSGAIASNNVAEGYVECPAEFCESRKA